MHEAEHDRTVAARVLEFADRLADEFRLRRQPRFCDVVADLESSVGDFVPSLPRGNIRHPMVTMKTMPAIVIAAPTGVNSNIVKGSPRSRSARSAAQQVRRRADEGRRSSEQRCERHGINSSETE